MLITLPDSSRLRDQAQAAGFVSVEQYVIDLLDRDADRVSIRQGLADLEAGRCRPSAEVEADLRQGGMLTALREHAIAAHVW